MLTDNLISYYKLDANSNDSVGSNNGTDTAVSYVAGKIGNAGSFNGSSSYINPPSSSIRPTGNFTVNSWINTSNTGAFKAIAQTYSQLSPAISGYRLLINSSNKLGLVSGKNTGYTVNTDYNEVFGSTTVTTGSWVMATGVYNGSTLEIFVNGVSDGSIAWTNAPAYQSDSKPSIGANNYQSTLINDYFNGLIDEVGIWSRALSPSEVTQLYNGGAGLTYPFTTQTFNPAFLMFV